jgi:hypothetical protein
MRGAGLPLEQMMAGFGQVFLDAVNTGNWTPTCEHNLPHLFLNGVQLLK